MIRSSIKTTITSITSKTTIMALTILAGLMVACGGAEPVSLSDHNYAGTYVGGAFPVQDFELVSADGPVKLSDFAGEYVVLYFGYTFCPDFCPATLAQMASVKEALGPNGEVVNVVMVSVDPERDTPELLEEYVGFFDPAFIGLTGSDEAIMAAAEPLGVFYEIGEVAENKEYYLVNHTTRTFLIGPGSEPLLTWVHDTSTDDIAADLEFIIENNS